MEKDQNILDKSRVKDLDDKGIDLLVSSKDLTDERDSIEEFPEFPNPNGQAQEIDFDDPETVSVLKAERKTQLPGNDVDVAEENLEIDKIFLETNVKGLARDPRRRDSLSTYLKNTKRFPMLAAHEEIELARRWIETGDETAKEKIVGAHLRLIAKIAQGYRGYSMSMLDLISEGHIGMMRAFDKFDPEKGVRFSTYAMWWVKASMRDYVMRNWSLVKTGTTAAQKKLFFNLRTMRSKMLKEGQNYLSKVQINQIAKELNVPVKAVREMAKRMNGNDYSLNSPIGGDNEGSWQDWLEDETQNHEAEIAQKDEFKKHYHIVEEAFEHLKPRELKVMKLRRLADPPKTLQEISVKLNLSRERIRQIEMKAFLKLQKKVRETVGSNYQGSEIIR